MFPLSDPQVRLAEQERRSHPHMAQTMVRADWRSLVLPQVSSGEQPLWRAVV